MSDKQMRTKYTREFKLEVVLVRRLRQWQWQLRLSRYRSPWIERQVLPWDA